MLIMLEMTTQDKSLIEALSREDKPAEPTLEQVRALKPDRCPHCRRGALHGHGWRRRTFWRSRTSWIDLWYWRLKCSVCGLLCRLIPAIVCPDVRSTTDRVERTLAPDARGAPGPDRRTRVRWQERLANGWPVAQSAGAVSGALSEWLPQQGWLAEALVQAARKGIALLAPAHARCSARTWDGREWQPGL